ncbi:MAG: putative minor tail protein [Prokaryotic dsDNA virus sp.]|nr:MAG: putative minor tail protein [Prokaryotic dsDNA virus sp.]
MAENLKQTIEFQAKGIERLKGQYKDLERRTKGLETSTKGSSSALGGMVAKLGLTTAALFGTSRAIAAVVSVGKEFESNMSNVAAISGAAGAELSALQKNAKELGSTTVFTASQVAGLQVEFAKLGFSSQEITGVTKDTLALASATGSDLSVAAAVAGQTLRAFGLDVSETSTVTDTMALSFSRSALDMDKFTNSMSFVAPIAKQVGFSVEETTAILGTLANAGISGSMAGTSLRRILLELGNENSKLTKKIGFSVKSTDDLDKAFKKLREDGIGTAEMKELVGQRAISAFNILMEGTETTKELTTALNDSGGAAQDMADVQLANFEGKLTLLNSAMEGLGISIFSHFSVPLSNAVIGITSFIGAIDRFISIPVSEKLIEEQNEFNALVKVLQKAQVEQSVRNDIIDRLQADYPDYIKNIDLETASIQDLKIAQEQANKAFKEKIRLTAAEEILTEARRKSAELAKKLTQAEIDLQLAEQKGAIITVGRGGALLSSSIHIDQARDDVEKYNAELNTELANLAALEKNLKKITEAQSVQNEEITEGVIAESNNLQIRKENLEISNEVAPVTASLTEGYERQRLATDSASFSFTTLKENLNQAAASAIFAAGSITSTSDAMGAAEQAAQQAAVAFIQAEIQKAVSSFISSQIASAGPLGFLVAPLALAGGAAFGSLMGSAVQRIQFAETGFSGVVDRPTMFMTGENNKAEQVNITPLESPNIAGGAGGGGITINVSAPLVDETVLDSILPAIARAQQMELA